MRRLILLLLLSGCDGFGPPVSLPIGVAGDGLPAIYTYPQLMCLWICTSHISVIRETASSHGGGDLTTGAKSNAQTSSASGRSK